MKKLFNWRILVMVASIAVLYSCGDDNDAVIPSFSSSGNNNKPNTPPNVDAGSDLEILPASELKLSGYFQDKETKSGTYLWRQVSGPSPATIDNPSSLVIYVSGLQPGKYVFEFKAQDAGGLSAVDSIKVNVIDLSAFQHEVVFDKVAWDCPWGCSTVISNIYDYIPQNQPILVFISYNLNWNLAKNGYEGSNGYSYYIDGANLALYTDFETTDFDVKIFY